MYEARQHKNDTGSRLSRQIEVGGVKQRMKFGDGRISANNHPILKNRLVKTSNSLNNYIVQRFFNVQQLGIALNPSDANKMAEVCMYLSQMHQALQHEGNIEIRIVNNWGMNPALTYIRGTVSQPALPIYRIDLELFYIKMSSVGEIVAMLTHELGVHKLADVQTGGHHPLGIVIPGAVDHGQRPGQQLFNVNIGTTTYNMDTGRAKQRDHVNAVDFSARMTARANNYLITFLELGDAIPLGTTQKHRDLTKTFLFDIARILVTNDGGMLPVATNTTNIASAMWNVYQNIVLPHVGHHQWINGAYTQETGLEIFTYLTGKLFSGVDALLSSHV